MVIILS